MRQSAVAAVLRIGTRGVDSTPHRAFFRAPPFISKCEEVQNRNAPHKTTGGIASPKGEARRECAGKAKRSECRAREDYGWGRAGGVTKPDQARSPPTTPHRIRIRVSVSVSARASASASASVSVGVSASASASASASV